MALGDTYERTFDEETVSENESTAGCPACGGTVQANTTEMTRDGCGLVTEQYIIDSGSAWRFLKDQPGDLERTGGLCTPHDSVALGDYLLPHLSEGREHAESDPGTNRRRHRADVCRWEIN